MTRRGGDRIVGRGRVECWEEQHGGSVFLRITITIYMVWFLLISLLINDPPQAKSFKPTKIL